MRIAIIVAAFGLLVAQNFAPQDCTWSAKQNAWTCPGPEKGAQAPGSSDGGTGSSGNGSSGSSGGSSGSSGNGPGTAK